MRALRVDFIQGFPTTRKPCTCMVPLKPFAVERIVLYMCDKMGRAGALTHASRIQNEELNPFHSHAIGISGLLG